MLNFNIHLRGQLRFQIVSTMFFHITFKGLEIFFRNIMPRVLVKYDGPLQLMVEAFRILISERVKLLWKNVA